MTAAMNQDPDLLRRLLRAKDRIDARPDWVVGEFRARYPRDSAEQLFHRIVTAARSFWRNSSPRSCHASAGSAEA